MEDKLKKVELIDRISAINAQILQLNHQSSCLLAELYSLTNLPQVKSLSFNNQESGIKSRKVEYKLDILRQFIGIGSK